MSIAPFKNEYLPAGEPIKRIDSGLVYFVHNGRNAWHSTWVQKYVPGCMHSTLDDAKRFCEGMRVNGSVFYIIETPAIAACFNYGKLIATQINTTTPLNGYSPNKTTAHTNSDKLSSQPLTIEELTTSLKIDSIHWEKSKHHNQPVILLWLFDPNAHVDKIKKRGLKTYKSISYGKKYLLGWSELENPLNSRKANEIAEIYSSNLETKKTTSTSSSIRTNSSQTRKNSAKDRAHSICGHLTKHYGKAVYLQELSTLNTNTFRAKLGVDLNEGIKDIYFIISTNRNSEIERVEHVEN